VVQVDHSSSHQERQVHTLYSWGGATADEAKNAPVVASVLETKRLQPIMTTLFDYKAGKGENKALGELRQLVTELKEVLDDDEIGWQETFHLVFGTHQKRVKGLLLEAGIRLDYYDPDTTYEEDARAYVTALDDLVSLK
jgi:hypothetical protein